MNFAVIPARGGSKRIPNKNIRLFNSKPIIAYSIETALASKLFDHVIVSTDSEEIAKIALQYGALVPFMRPCNISDDHSTTVQVINHAIRYMQSCYEGITQCCCIYATAPFLRIDYLKQGMDALVAQPEKSFAFSVTEFAFPTQRALTISKGQVSAVYPEHRNTRSQDLISTYHDAGQFYCGTVDGFLSEKPVFSEHSVPIVLPSYLVQDIDTLDDWKRAELMYHALLIDS
jgi:N-acylneuraminate cytidylyltransferase